MSRNLIYCQKQDKKLNKYKFMQKHKKQANACFYSVK